MASLILASSTPLFNANSFDAVVQGFATFAAFITIASSLLAWIVERDDATVAEIADAAGLGLAVGFLPGALAGGYVYYEVAMHGLSLS